MKAPQKFILVVGLGNPEKKYEETYHNVGFLVVDSFLRALSGKEKETFQKNKLFLHRKIRGYMLVKPITSMNTSGVAVKKAISFFGITPEKMLIIHDDSDIPMGSYKLSFGKNSAGHHGVESVIQELRTKKFWRLRIGTRKTSGKAGAFVLKKISETDRMKFQLVFDALMANVMAKENP